VFTVPKALLCNSSTYFRAALNGPFIEGQTQTIDLDDEDPSIFRTYVAWLYQKQLNSQDIEEELDDPQDFGLHVAEVIVFADKRDVSELKNDAISMLLTYLRKTGLAALKVINYVYDQPESPETYELRLVLAHEEVWFGHRLDKKISHWHPEFMAEIIKVYKRHPPYPGRFLDDLLLASKHFCSHVHKHAFEVPNCTSLANNTYLTGPPPTQEPSNKKRKTMPSTPTVEVLDD
jgi:hypothetical protein